MGAPDGFDGPRACGPFELAPTLDLINLVFRTQRAAGGPAAPSMGWDYSHIYHPDNLHNVRVVLHGGRPVASIAVYDTAVRTALGTLSLGGINAVATHPDFRRLGLATLTLEDCHRRMLQSGDQVGLLSTGITNWYRKLGWERAGRQRSFTFDRRNVDALPAPSGFDVTEDWEAHLDALCALHNAAPLGATRTADRFALLVRRKMPRLFVALRAGRPVAYVATAGSAVREYGGETADVAALLRHAFGAVEHLPARSTERSGAQQGQFEMQVQTPDGAAGLPGLLLGLGVPTALTYLGMLAVLDPPALFAALNVDAAVERRGDVWRLRLDGRVHDLSPGELVKLVFGPERRPDVDPDRFPIDFYQWPADRV